MQEIASMAESQKKEGEEETTPIFFWLKCDRSTILKVAFAILSNY
jgi:hypothetical protein